MPNAFAQTFSMEATRPNAAEIETVAAIAAESNAGLFLSGADDHAG